MRQQPAFNLPFVGCLGDGEKVEVLGVFKYPFGEVGARRRQDALEVGQRLPFPLMQSALDLEDENVSAPTVLDRCPEVPLPQNRILELVEEDAEMTPRQKCHKL